MTRVLMMAETIPSGPQSKRRIFKANYEDAWRSGHPVKVLALAYKIYDPGGSQILYDKKYVLKRTLIFQMDIECHFFW